MTLIHLPEGQALPAEFGGGHAVAPINGLLGCYEGMLGWIEFQWPDLKFDDSFNARAQREFWNSRSELMKAWPDDETRPIIPPELEWDSYPPAEYGVGDSPHQVMSHPSLEWVRTDPRQFVVVFREIRRRDQPETQGWRFHKSGSYIGEHEVEWEYLAEQDGIRGERIDSVVVYHVVMVEEN